MSGYYQDGVVSRSPVLLKIPFRFEPVIPSDISVAVFYLYQVNEVVMAQRRMKSTHPM